MHVNQLTNDPRVSQNECMLACRYTIVSASVDYQSNNIESNQNHSKALGYQPPSVNNDQKSEVLKIEIGKPMIPYMEKSSNDARLVSIEFSIAKKKGRYVCLPPIHHNVYIMTLLVQREFIQELNNMPSTQAVIDTVQCDSSIFEEDISNLRQKLV